MTPGSRLEPILQQLATQSRHDQRAPLVRFAVRLRSGDACEYCLLPTLGRFQIDHIIPPERWLDYVAGRIRALTPTSDRQGPHHIDNYAWACPFCNAAKSDQVVRRVGRDQHRLYDPRRDVWIEHFRLANRHLLIIGISDIGAATVQTLRMNDSRLDGPVALRHEAILEGAYPPFWARNTLTDPR